MASRALRRDPPLTIQFRVMKALLLRDLRTRFFGHGLGYIIAILWPLAHMVMLLIVYVFAGRVAPYGSSTLLFLAIGVVPVISYMYMSRFIMTSVIMKRPLLAFPVVKLLDIILARVVLEAASACCVAAILALVLICLDEPIAPREPFQAAAAFFFILVVGAGFGAINALISLKLQMWIIVSILLNVIIYITSSILFLPAALPAEVRVFIIWNPTLHAVEWLREAYYVDYQSVVLSKNYLMISGIVLVFSALSLERVFRRVLMR